MRAVAVARRRKIGNSPAMSKHRLIPFALAAGLMTLAVPTMLISPAFLSKAWAASEDLQEVLKKELEGDKVGAYLKLKEMAPEGDPEAQYRLGGYYQYGWAGPANFKLAREWYGRAAAQGHPEAMLGLAVMDAQGQGAPVDKKASFTWLTIAATYLKEPDELNKVAGLRDKYKGELSSGDLNAALAEAMAFQPVKEQH